MSKPFRFYYIFNGYQYRHGLTAKDIVEAKSKAQRHLDEWNAVRNSVRVLERNGLRDFVRVLEWVEEVSETYKYFYEHRSVDGRLVQKYGWLYAENVTEAKAEAIHRIGELEFTDPRHRKLLWVELD